MADQDLNPRESVVITDFWRSEVRFHKRNDAKQSRTQCNAQDIYRMGAALPREHAEKIARPCYRCWPPGV